MLFQMKTQYLSIVDNFVKNRADYRGIFGTKEKLHQTNEPHKSNIQLVNGYTRKLKELTENKIKRGRRE